MVLHAIAARMTSVVHMMAEAVAVGVGGSVIVIRPGTRGAGDHQKGLKDGARRIRPTLAVAGGALAGVVKKGHEKWFTSAYCFESLMSTLGGTCRRAL